MEMLLELFDSVITFRARYQRHDDLLALTDMLVLDSANPGPMPACCGACAPNWASCPAARNAGAPAGPAACTGPGSGRWTSCAVPTTRPSPARCRRFLARLLDSAMALANQVSERFFTLAHGMDQRV
jgi:uncharacterized alpha-E superfamily protein